MFDRGNTMVWMSANSARSSRAPQVILNSVELAQLPTLPLVISAPFGNYVQPTGATATLGTFTLEPRPGRLWRVLSTVRYYRRLGAWVNRIGLRNPGVRWLLDHVAAKKIDVSDKIISIHGFNADQWFGLLDQIGHIRPLAIELNMSCPNVGQIDWPTDLFARANKCVAAIIVKLPPVHYGTMADQAVDHGLKFFHCCNTLPIPIGGLSGRPLKPVALQCIRDLRCRSYGNDLTIIGGGGIREPRDIDEYHNAGANHFALGTKLMNPRYLFSHRPLKPLFQRAQSYS